MKKETSRNLRLALFVLGGIVFLIVALYMIGDTRNMFSKTFSVYANFHDVNGLTEGNNVRFSGIDVGTVQDIEVKNDTSVTVRMIIEEKYHKYIKKNSVAEIGTDGLMGNKLVNINSVSQEAPPVTDGGMLATYKPLETDEILRTLSFTNDNVKEITDNLKEITAKINSDNSLWNLLSDSTIASDVKSAIVNIRMTSQNSAVLTGNLSSIASDIRSGKGTMGALITDSTLSTKLRKSIVNIEMVSDSMALVTGDLHTLTAQAKSGNGAIGTLVMDTTFANNMRQTMDNLQKGTANFNDNMEAIKGSILFRHYFKKKAQQEQTPVTSPQTSPEK